MIMMQNLATRTRQFFIRMRMPQYQLFTNSATQCHLHALHKNITYQPSSAPCRYLIRIPTLIPNG